MSTYVHAIDGRLRVRLPALRGNRRAAAELRRELRALPGVNTVTPNPLTGSVLVEYDSTRLSNDDILDRLGVEPPAATDASATGSLFGDESSAGPKVQDVVAEKVIEFAAERLLLAALA